MSNNGKLAVLNSVFTSNSASAVVRLEAGVCSIVASNFTSNSRAIYGKYSSQITVDCTTFFNSSISNYIDSNTLLLVSLCAETFAVGEMGLCQENDCKGK